VLPLLVLVLVAMTGVAAAWCGWMGGDGHASLLAQM